MWKFQTRTDGEDPLVEWKKLKSEGKIKKLKREEGPGGGIPIPMASFGVGGEFGVGGGEWCRRASTCRNATFSHAPHRRHGN
mmetsp:Transcript_93794/g.268490  ORF Transcript_93794/g.268490 Transcript_93794/m.268490 type:complete len:82 (+) Transcript_93794:643-888(+)